MLFDWPNAVLIRSEPAKSTRFILLVTSCNNELFLVPLWYNEIYFDNSGNEIIVLCEPEIPEHIKLDDDNNIYIEKKIDLLIDLPNLIINDSSINIMIGDKTFYILVSELLMKREQYYIIKKQGLTKINEEDVYNVSEKADIIIKIIMV